MIKTPVEKSAGVFVSCYWDQRALLSQKNTGPAGYRVIWSVPRTGHARHFPREGVLQCVNLLDRFKWGDATKIRTKAKRPPNVGRSPQLA